MEPPPSANLEGAVSPLEKVQGIRQQLETFIRTPALSESQRLVAAYPELLSELAFSLLQQMIDDAQSQNNTDDAKTLESYLTLLHQCRRVGIAQAFAEKLNISMTATAVPAIVDQFRKVIAQTRRYFEINDVDALDRLIEHITTLLCSPEFRCLPLKTGTMLLNDAGGVYLHRYWAKGNREDLGRCIAAYQEAVVLTPQSSPNRAMYLNNLGTSLNISFGITGNRFDLERAITILQEGINLTSDTAPDRAIRLATLGNSLRTRFAYMGNPDDLENALVVFQEAVALSSLAAPERPGILNSLSICLGDRYTSTGNILDLDHAITICYEALQLAPLTSPTRALYLNNLGDHLHTRFARIGNLIDLEGAITVLQEAVNRTPHTVPDRTKFLTNLGNCLRTRFAHTGKSTDLERSIAAYQEAVVRISHAGPERAAVLNGLAHSLRLHFEDKGDPNDLEHAIIVLQEAVNTTPFSAPSRPTFLTNLGICLRMRYQHTGNLADLEISITILQEAVGGVPPTALSRTTILTALGASLYNRFVRTGDQNDLERAIAVLQETVNSTLPSAPDRAAILANLGIYWSKRFALKGDSSDLNNAIAIFEEAVDAIPVSAPRRTSLLVNLGIGLRNRFSLTGDIADLERAITVFQEAVDSTSPSVPDRSTVLANLGIGLRIRYERNATPADLERAIAIFQEALNLASPTAAYKASRFNDLGTGLSKRFTRTGNLEDLERAIVAFQEAVSHVSLDAPDRAGFLTNLGNGLRNRFEHTNNLADLERAIVAYQEAIDATLPTAADRSMHLNNLATGLSSRFAQTNNVNDLERATTAFREACQTGLELAPSEVVRSGRNWGKWALERRAWSEATEAYRFSLNALERLYLSQSLLKDRASWLRELTELPLCAAFALARLGELEGAVTVLEQGRTRLLRESMEQDTSELMTVQAHAPHLFDQYQHVAQHVRVLERQERADTSNGENINLRQQVRAARHALEQTITTIRALPGHESFLHPPDFSTVLAMVKPDAPLVYLVTTALGSLTLVVALTSATKRYQVSALWSESFTSTQLNALLVQRDEKGIIRGYLPSQLGTAHELSTSLASLLSTVGTSLIAPLALHLRMLGCRQVTLIPTGRLALLPLHAATYNLDGESSNLLYELEVSYTSSASVLQSLVGSKQYSRNAGRLTAIGNPLPSLALGMQVRDGLFDLRESLLEIQHHLLDPHEKAKGNLLGASQHPRIKMSLSVLRMLTTSAPELILKAGDFLREVALQIAPFAPKVAHQLAALALPLLHSLPHAKAEVQSIVALFSPGEATAHYESEATSSALWQSLPSATIAHFACHGRFNNMDALDSALFLAEGKRLTLRELLTTDPSAFRALQLVVLSACQTAISDFTNLPDEGLGLPAGFLQAGIPAVIGSLWPVNDVSTALLMVRFYELLLGNNAEDHRSFYPPATALRMAQLWLCEATGDDLECFVQRHPTLQSIVATRWKEGSTKYPFADPYYWAAFLYMGLP